MPEGEFVGQPLKMADFMKDDFRAIYDNPHGTRQAIISRGRKNAKTTESAIITLLHLCGPEALQNSRLYSSALSRDQAAILYRLASQMVRLSPVLHASITTRDTSKELYCPELGTMYSALSADASTNFGLSPALIVHDELGQVRGPRHDLYEALETATAAQKEPLSIIISTQAANDTDLLSVLIDDAMGGHNPRTVLRFQCAPDDLDAFSEDAIRAANPAFDVFMNKREVLEMAAAAERMPSRQAQFENLILNRRVEASSPAVTKKVWEANADPPDDWGAVYGGLDLSETGDLTALVLVSPVGGFFNVRCTFWLPKEGLAERSRIDRVPYDLWAERGHLATTPGSAIEYEYVAGELARLFREQDIRKIAFDRHNMKHLKPWLVKAGLSDATIEDKFEDFGQGYFSMSPAWRTTEAALLNERIRHGSHPVLNMCAANAIIKRDEAGNRKFDKKRATGRIDGMVALTMAIAMASEDMNEQAVYPVPIEKLLEDLSGGEAQPHA